MDLFRRGSNQNTLNLFGDHSTLRSLISECVCAPPLWHALQMEQLEADICKAVLKVEAAEAAVANEKTALSDSASSLPFDVRFELWKAAAENLKQLRDEKLVMLQSTAGGWMAEAGGCLVY